MIAQVDEALREIVTDEALEGADLEVVFDAPTKDWAARRNAPTVNLYLYDIREDMRRRPAGYLEERDDERPWSTLRRPAPRFYKLSYLVTAWTQRPEDEHRLLDNLLRAFLKYDALPDHLVVGQLAEPRRVGQDDDRPAAAGGPGLRGRLVGARRRAEAVARPGRRSRRCGPGASTRPGRRWRTASTSTSRDTVDGGTRHRGASSTCRHRRRNGIRREGAGRGTPARRRRSR